MTQQSSMKKPPRREEAAGGNIDDTEAYEGVIRVAIDISKRQAADLKKIKEALLVGDQETALTDMKKFLGVA